MTSKSKNKPFSSCPSGGEHEKEEILLRWVCSVAIVIIFFTYVYDFFQKGVRP